MSQLADMAGVLADSLEKGLVADVQFHVRLGVRLMEAAEYDAESIIWALERVMADTTQFTAHRAIREEIDRIREEEKIL